MSTAPASVDPETCVLDVRSPTEFEAERLPGSLNLPLDLLRSQAGRVRQLLDGRDVLLVCRSGERARQAQRALEAGGLPARVLDGGLLRWAADGGGLETGSPRRAVWVLERQVRLAAGTLVLAGLAAGRRAPRARVLSTAVGAGLTWSAVSGTCGMATVLARLPWNRGSTADPEALLDALRRTALGQREVREGGRRTV